MSETQATLKLIYAHRDRLTKQQILTLKGQVLSGDITGAIKGLARLLNSRADNARA